MASWTSSILSLLSLPASSSSAKELGGDVYSWLQPLLGHMATESGQLVFRGPTLWSLITGRPAVSAEKPVTQVTAPQFFFLDRRLSCRRNASGPCKTKPTQAHPWVYNLICYRRVKTYLKEIRCSWWESISASVWKIMSTIRLRFGEQ